MRWVFTRKKSGVLFKKYRVILVCGLVAAIAVAVWFGPKAFQFGAAHSRQEQNVILVNLPPPPPDFLQHRLLPPQSTPHSPRRASRR